MFSVGKWVTKFLTNNHKEKRLASSLDFSIRCGEGGDGMFSQIVTGDEISPESFMSP